jgi:hypothetical protein
MILMPTQHGRHRRVTEEPTLIIVATSSTFNDAGLRARSAVGG